MADRMIDISSSAKLFVRLGRLVIERQDEEESAIPLEDIGAVVVSHGSVLFTHAVLSGLAKVGAAFIVCDEKHLPVGMLLSLDTHHAQQEVFSLQAALKLPVRKRLWKQIIQTKLHAQGALLKSTVGSDAGLSTLETHVRSGDPTNVEAQAARRYWSALFGAEFRRDREEGALNAYLNYGYAILRGLVARSVCGAGLHPSLSLHHHNRYDSFALADDLMEPFRPAVDLAVWAMRESRAVGDDVSKEGKREILKSLTGFYPYTREESRTLFDMTARTASSLVAVIRWQGGRLNYPTCWQFSTS
jgi:CRISP-associated protein Cas1